MSQYMTKGNLHSTCTKLRDFYIGLSSYYKEYDLDIESNRGRRNILMSEPMEAFLANELREHHKSVIADGRTGKADIVIETEAGTEIELECKLTSPHLSSGTIAFQTDYETLEKKKSLDYIYIIADATFEKFCAIYFEGLTTEDFRPLSPGARGKVQMYKHKGMKKATVLLGEAIDLNDMSINKAAKNHYIYRQNAEIKIENLNLRLQKLKQTRVYDRNKIKNSIEIVQNDLSLKINKFNKDIIIKKDRVSRYTFNFESLER